MKPLPPTSDPPALTTTTTKPLKTDDRVLAEVAPFFDYFLNNELPPGEINDVLEKNFAVFALQTKMDPKVIESKYAEHGWPLNNLKGWLTRVNAGELTEVSVGELVLWCRKRRPDLEEQFFADKGFFGFKSFQTPTEVFIKKYDEACIYNSIKTNDKINPSFEKTWSLWKVSIGAGQYDKFIFLEKGERLTQGVQDVYLQLVDKEIAFERLKYLTTAGLLGLGQVAGYKQRELQSMFTQYQETQKCTLHDYLLEQIIKPFFEHHDFYKLGLPLDKSEFTKHANHLELAENLVTLGADQYDQTVVRLLLAQIPEVEPTKIEPSAYMKHAPNIMLITNGDVAKSTTSSRICDEPPVTDFSAANLLGWSNTERRQIGKLDGRTKATFLDEWQNVIEEGIVGQLMTYEEVGESERAKGMTTRCRGYSALVFLGNVLDRNASEVQDKSKLDKFTLNELLKLQSFKDLFSKLNNTNKEPASRRKALILFNEDCTPIKGVGMSDSEERMVRAIIRTLAEAFKAEFTAAFLRPEMQAWLSSPHTTDYLAQLTTLDGSCADDDVRLIIRGQKQNYRHARGLAFRLAWLETGLSMTLRKTWDDSAFIQCADKWFAWVEMHSSESLARVCAYASEQVQDLHLHSRFDTYGPKYAKVVLYAFLKAYNEDAPALPLAQLESAFPDVKVLLGIQAHEKYNGWAVSRDAFVKSLPVRKAELAEFGIRITDSQGHLLFGVLDKDKARIQKLQQRLNEQGSNGSNGSKTTNEAP